MTRETITIVSSLYPLRPSMTTGVWKWDLQAEKTKARRQPWEQRRNKMSNRPTGQPTSTAADIDIHRCDSYPEATIKPIVSGMAGVIELSHLFMQANAALVDTLVKALQGMGHAPPPPCFRVTRRPDN